MNPVFMLLLQSHRSQQTKAWRLRNKNPRIPKTKYPNAIEDVYADAIMELQGRFVADVLAVVVSRVPLTLDGAAVVLRKDGVEEDYEKLRSEIEAVLLAIYGSGLAGAPELEALLARTATKLKAFHQSQFASQIAAVAGTPFNVDIPNWIEIQKAWESANYTYIRSLSEEYIAKLNKTVLAGIQAGLSLEELSAQVRKISDSITGFRARLIARDQIGKLNNKVIKSLHTNLGLGYYIWTTYRDERVRGNPTGRYPKAVPSHWAIDYMICSWADSTIYSDDIGKTWKKRTSLMPLVEPGIEIQCRCLPGPVFISPIKEVDKKIDGEE